MGFSFVSFLGLMTGGGAGCFLGVVTKLILSGLRGGGVQALRFAGSLAGCSGFAWWISWLSPGMFSDVHFILFVVLQCMRVCVRPGSLALAWGVGGVSVGTRKLVLCVVVPILAHALRGNTLPPWWLRFKVPLMNVNLTLKLNHASGPVPPGKHLLNHG